MDSFHFIKFSDAPVTLIDGDRGKNYPKRSDMHSSGYCLFLDTKNVTSDGGFNFSECKFITKDKDLLLRKGKLEKYDIVLTTRGTLGNVAFYSDRVKYDHIRINSGMLIFRITSENVLPIYLYQYLKSSIFKKFIKKFSSGTAQPQLPIKDINYMQMPLPQIITQKKIASVLSTYDKLIENNTRRIEILEEMAQRIYKEWFVDFKYPGHENDELVNSELGMIPEGWEVKSFEDILDSIESGSRPKGGIDPNEKGVPSIGAENVLGLGKYSYSKEKFISHDFFKNMKKGHLKSSDVLLYKDGAKLGRKTMFKNDFPHNKCAINEHVFILRTNENLDQVYLYFWIDLPGTTQQIINLNTNAAQPGINQMKVKGLKIIAPQKEVRNKFYDIANTLLDQLFNLAKKNELLSQTRDYLLPKLISGKVDVSDLDIDTGILDD